MEKGWDATGKLSQLWKRVGGRDELADLTGITPGTLSGYNTGRLGLGSINAQRIATALGVTVLELGAPEEEADAAGLTMLDRLLKLEDDLAESVESQTKLTRKVTALQARVKKLEARGVPGQGVAGGQA